MHLTCRASRAHSLYAPDHMVSDRLEGKEYWHVWSNRRAVALAFMLEEITPQHLRLVFLDV